MKTARQCEPARRVGGNELHEAVLQGLARWAVAGLEINGTVRRTRKAVARLADSGLARIRTYHIDGRLRQIRFPVADHPPAIGRVGAGLIALERRECHVDYPIRQEQSWAVPLAVEVEIGATVGARRVDLHASHAVVPILQLYGVDVNGSVVSHS